MTKNLQSLPSASLDTIARSLRSGTLSHGVSLLALKHFVGSVASGVFDDLNGLKDEGFTEKQIAILLDTIAESERNRQKPTDLIDLVLSGPSVDGVPTCSTAVTIQTLFDQSESEILLVGFAIQNAERIFSRLAKRMTESPSLQVTLCLNVHRTKGDTSLPEEIVKRFRNEFRTKHWPWGRLPEVYYDPRSLEMESENRASMHAKCVVVDRRMSLITSANFTKYAQERNIEVGVLLRFDEIARKIEKYFRGLIASESLVKVEI